MLTFEFTGMEQGGIRLASADLRRSLNNIAAEHGRASGHVGYVFVSDDELLAMNKEFRGGDYFTDVLTFPYETDPLEGEVYISWERILDHAREYGITPAEELARVIIHGLLHLLGWSDETPEEKQVMRELENKALSNIDVAAVFHVEHR